MNPSVILCPIDLSASATSALAQAIALARWYDADLHVAGVRAGRASWQGVDPAKTGADYGLAALMESVPTAGLRLTTAVLHGDPVTAIARHAQSLRADLAVVARNGRGDGIPWRPGVNATDLARALACPTLAVPEAARGSKRAFANILCATDFSPASAAARRTALNLAQQSGGKLTLLHVSPGAPYDRAYSGLGALELLREDRTRMARTEQKLRHAVPVDAFNWCVIDTTVVSGVPHRAVLEMASGISADLIVMGTSERTGLSRLITASTTAPVLREAACPVLVVRGGSDASRVMVGSESDTADRDGFAIAPWAAASAVTPTGWRAWGGRWSRSLNAAARVSRR